MQIDSELCHADSDKVIVRVSASEQNIKLGSALGQGKSVVEAEDNALNRLKTRISSDVNQNSNKSNIIHLCSKVRRICMIHYMNI